MASKKTKSPEQLAEEAEERFQERLSNTLDAEGLINDVITSLEANPDDDDSEVQLDDALRAANEIQEDLSSAGSVETVEDFDYNVRHAFEGIEKLRENLKGAKKKSKKFPATLAAIEDALDSLSELRKQIREYLWDESMGPMIPMNKPILIQNPTTTDTASPSSGGSSSGSSKATKSSEFPWLAVGLGGALVAAVGYVLYKSQQSSSAASAKPVGQSTATTPDKGLALPAADRQPTVFAVPFAFGPDAVTEVNQLFNPKTGEWVDTPNSEYMDDYQDLLLAMFDKLQAASLVEASKIGPFTLAPMSEASKAASELAACKGHEPPSPLVIYKWLTKGPKTSRYALLVRSCDQPSEMVDISSVPTKQMPDEFATAKFGGATQ